MPVRGHVPAKTRFWSQHIKAWKASGLQQKEYCAKKKLGLKSFGRWKRILEQLAPGQLPASPRIANDAGGMLPLTILPESPQNGVSERAPADAGLRLQVGERYVISLSIGFHVPTLQVLLNALG